VDIASLHVILSAAKDLPVAAGMDGEILRLRSQGSPERSERARFAQDDNIWLSHTWLGHTWLDEKCL
jgi:hypothetical protein